MLHFYGFLSFGGSSENSNTSPVLIPATPWVIIVVILIIVDHSSV